LIHISETNAPRVMYQVNHPPENNKRREIPPLVIFKSCSAGNQGRFSNSVIDEIVPQFIRIRPTVSHGPLHE